MAGAYRGIGITLLGSAPCSALFFSTYETAVPMVDEVYCSIGRRAEDQQVRCQEVAYRRGLHGCELRYSIVNATAAAIGELVAATVRTPIETLKQRRQVFSSSDSRLQLRAGALWRGWTATLMRDVPFSMIQYPLYHAAKRYACTAKPDGSCVEDPWRAALCGSCTSATAAALTTPFDVAQTRVMLSDGRHNVSVIGTMRDLASSKGVSALFAGVVPRAAWMGLGGLIFLGTYEYGKSIYHQSVRGCDRQTQEQGGLFC